MRGSGVRGTQGSAGHDHRLPPAGVLAVADTIKDDSPAAVAALRGLGLGVVMITGDNARTTEVVKRDSGDRPDMCPI
jgi:P-type E1-E2 ATPase